MKHYRALENELPVQAVVIQRYLGTVRFFSEERGWGFITPANIAMAGGRDLFVHKSAVTAAGLVTLVTGQRLKFTLGERGGRPLAVELELLT
jgi:cold shock protein